MTPIAHTPVSLKIFIDSQAFTTKDADQEAAALLRLAGRDPKNFDLFLIHKNGVEDKINDGRIINLKNGQKFVSREKVRFTIDGDPFSTYDNDQTAAALLRLAGVDPTGYDLARIGDAQPFANDDIITIQTGDEFVTAKRVGGVA
ncbi:hypothetical protein [Microbacterium sp. Root280D1]|uniref:hypothetical protein n=1 Tax=Microbacterium sp. Root280D1 TaxID=1736510 RepID=UPI0006FACF38|nr:hypothetical protein [Microbacterium sp. Root280D1]KRD53816.1 hypothetical protein ASE34_01570 [Microbacterium sp. Root280D1]